MNQNNLFEITLASGGQRVVNLSLIESFSFVEKDETRDARVEMWGTGMAPEKYDVDEPIQVERIRMWVNSRMI